MRITDWILVLTAALTPTPSTRCLVAIHAKPVKGAEFGSENSDALTVDR